MTETETDWRLIDGVATAWFEAPSLSAAAALAGRVAELAGEIDLRRNGVRVRVDSAGSAEAASAAAGELGLVANPAVLQQLSVVIESPQPAPVSKFWQQALDYSQSSDGSLTDPLRRDPTVRIRSSDDLRPLRDRVHVDAVRPGDVAAELDLGEASGPYGVRHVDPDGNEVDLVPGELLDGVDDWQVVFSAMACYRVSSPDHQTELAQAAAAVADEMAFPLLVDLCPGLVIIDSGKDQWEAESHGLPVDFTEVARRVASAAHEIGAVADLGLPRFVQVVLDAVDIAAARTFWAAALGYVYDRRDGVTDLYDPLRLNPVLVFQDFDASEVDRRRQRNRISFELAVPSDVATARVAAMVAAGGRLVEESTDRWRVSDPEGNEVVVISG